MLRVEGWWLRANEQCLRTHRLVLLQSVGAAVAAELSLRRLDCALVNALPPADSTQLTDANVQAFGIRPMTQSDPGSWVRA